MHEEITFNSMGGIFNEFMTEVYGAFSKNKCKIYINVNVFP